MIGNYQRKTVVPLGEKISLKYLGYTSNHPIAKMISEDSKKGGVGYLWKLIQSSFLLGIMVKCNDSESNFVIIKKYRIHCHL